MACFNAAARVVRKVREIERKRAGVTDTSDAPEEEIYDIAAQAMFDFMDAIKLFQKSGSNPDRQAFAAKTVSYFAKATGN